MAAESSDGQAPGSLARLIAGERRPSEIVAEVDEGKPVSFLTQLQFELLTPAQRAVGFGLVDADRKRKIDSESESESEPDDGPDEQPYLDLIVDIERQEIQRSGYPGRVILSGPVAWPMFLALFNAKGALLSRQQVENLPGEGQAARRTAKRRINEKLKDLSIEIPCNEWRLVEISKA